jgi:hypothetical protein
MKTDPKIMDAQMEIRLLIKKEDKTSIGQSFTIFAPYQSVLHSMIEDIERFFTMSFLNGWFVREDGDCECLYGGKIVKGFEFGKYNKVTKNFNPRAEPCSCRSN